MARSWSSLLTTGETTLVAGQRHRLSQGPCDPSSAQVDPMSSSTPAPTVQRDFRLATSSFGGARPTYGVAIGDRHRATTSTEPSQTHKARRGTITQQHVYRVARGQAGSCAEEVSAAQEVRRTCPVASWPYAEKLRSPDSPVGRLEEAFAENAPPKILEKLLLVHGDKLSACDDPYSPPSASSRSKVQSGSVTLADGKKLTVSQKEREVVLKLSGLLNLDEVEALVLWRQFWEQAVNKEEGHLEDGSDVVLEAAGDFYFAERQSVLAVFSMLLHKGARACTSARRQDS